MATPTFYTAGLKTYSASPTINTTTSHSITKPDDVVAGDLILLVLSSTATRTTGVFPFAWPAEFTPIGTHATGATTHRTCAGAAYKIAGGSEPASYSFDYDQHTSTSYAFRAVAVRVTDYDATTPAGAFSGASAATSSDTSVTVGTLTADADSLLVGHLQYQGAPGNTVTPPSGFTARASSTSSAGYNTSERSWAGGATGSLGFTMSLGAHATAVVFAINGADDIRLIPDVEPLYYIGTLLGSKTGIHFSVTAGHGDIAGELLGFGTNGTTDDLGNFVLPAAMTLSGDVSPALNDPVTLHLYWEEGTEPVVDRSLIVKTTLVAEA